VIGGGVVTRLCGLGITGESNLRHKLCRIYATRKSAFSLAGGANLVASLHAVEALGRWRAAFVEVEQ
jgi:hypothetical protein